MNDEGNTLFEILVNKRQLYLHMLANRRSVWRNVSLSVYIRTIYEHFGSSLHTLENTEEPGGSRGIDAGGRDMSYEIAEAMLARRGVHIDAIAEIVYRLQKGYHPELTMDDCVTSVKSVLQKREVQYTLYTGIALDELAEKSFYPNRCKR